MDLAADQGNDLSQVFSIFFKIKIIRVDNQQGTFLIPLDPFIVFLVEALEVIKAHTSFIGPAAIVNVFYKRRNARLQVYQQVRR